MNTCICGSHKAPHKCCYRFLDGQQWAKTPEQLMRSRYSAYALGGYGEYLLKTWLPDEAGAQGLSALQLSEKNTEWVGLDVLAKGQKGDDGWVEFKAYYIDAENDQSVMHECSSFKRIKGRWYYVNGVVT